MAVKFLFMAVKFLLQILDPLRLIGLKYLGLGKLQLCGFQLSAQLEYLLSQIFGLIVSVDDWSEWLRTLVLVVNLSSGSDKAVGADHLGFEALGFNVGHMLGLALVKTAVSTI